MRILMLHNRYQWVGGEDISTLSEAELLRSRGHAVDLWELSNDGIQSENPLVVAAEAIWSRKHCRSLAQRLRANRYDVLAVQNCFPRFSPAVHRVAARHGVASIHHLRNYRLTCVNASLFREGRDCRLCLGRAVPWKGVQHACYRDSRAASAVVAATVATHRLIGTWRDSVTRYIANSNHTRDVHLQAGLPASKISVRPSIVVVPQVAAADSSRRGVFLASRLSEEKGIDVAIRAWRSRPRNETLEIAGVGPFEERLRSEAAGDPSIRFLGYLAHDDVVARMAGARLVVVCPQWAEPLGRTAIEAIAVGTPVVASAVGGLVDILGMSPQCLVPPGDARALDLLMTNMLSDKSMRLESLDAMRRNYMAHYDPDVLAAKTEMIFEAAIAERRAVTDAS